MKVKKNLVKLARGVLLLWSIWVSLQFCPKTTAQTIVNVFLVPEGGSGLAWDGHQLWMGFYGTGSSLDDQIYKINPADGSTNGIIASPANDCFGLTWQDSCLWFLNAYSTNTTYQLDTLGNIISSFPNLSTYMAGLAWDGTYLWTASYYDPDGWIYQITTTGSMVQSFQAPDNQPWDLAWDGEFLWMADKWGDAYYKINSVDGSLDTSYASPGTDPAGIAWDGHYLWLVDEGEGYNNDFLYQIDVYGAGTPEIQLSETEHDYGLVVVGDSAWWALTISSIGTADLVVDSLIVTNIAFFVLGTEFPVTLSPGQDTTITLGFSPPSLGSFSASTTVFSNDPTHPAETVFLNGQGLVEDPDIWASDQFHDFGTVRVGGVAAWGVTLTNLGFVTLSVDSITGGNGVFNLPPYSYPILIQPTQSEPITVEFSPPTVGIYEDTLYIYSNDPDQPVLILQVAGTGDDSSIPGGQLLWFYQGAENVVCVAALPDIDGNGLPDVAAESYDAGASGDHFFAIAGNSDGLGVVRWATGEGMSGGWGDQCVAAFPDVTGDGVGEVLWGTAWGGRTAYLLNGTDGEVIWSYDTHQDDDGGWVYSISPIGDVNGDLLADVLVGAGSSGGGTSGSKSIYCFNGASQGTGEIIWRYQADDAVMSVAPLGDVNGDGIVDALAGAGGNGLDDKIYCIDGASSGFPATVLWEYPTGGSVWSVTSIPDVNGDRLRDALAGSWGGGVICISGDNGTLIWNQLSEYYIMRVEVVPDLNGDHFSDVIVASWADDVYVLSGADGSIIWSYPTGGDVWAVSGIPDLNGDGTWEVLAGSFDGRVYCIDGDEGGELWNYYAGDKIFTLRYIEDISGDGLPDVVAGTQMLGGSGGQILCIEGGEEMVGVEEEPFWAIPREDGILLKWDSGALSAEGYNLYRSPQDFCPKLSPIVSDFNGQNLRLFMEKEVAQIEAEKKRMGAAAKGVFTKINTSQIQGDQFLDEGTVVGESYLYKLGAVDGGGGERFYGPIRATGVGPASIPINFTLFQNYPNPFNPDTEIRYLVSKDSYVVLKIFNILGEEVRTLVNDEKSAGSYLVVWDGRNDAGDDAASGVYFCCLKAGSFKAAKKMILIR